MKRRALLSGVLAILALPVSAQTPGPGPAASALDRRWLAAARAFAAANLAFIVWLVLTLALILQFNYSWGTSESANFSSGAVLVPWLRRLSPRGAVAAMFNEFGALWILAPCGMLLASAELRRLAIAALPLAAVFGVLEQPDRALWNFHFLVTPLSALVLEIGRAHV